LVETLESAVETGKLSKKLLRELAQKFGLEATQEAAAACIHDKEECAEAMRREAAIVERHMGFLFSDEFAKKIGAWPRPAGYTEA
jgi:hypothetical protein